MIHSFLIIGQSNMAGRGDMSEAQPITDKRLLVLRNGRWQSMFRPINHDRSFSGVSLAETVAAMYAEEHDVLTGIIPCADGGTSLRQWQEGSLLYDHAVYQARLAQRTSTIVGVLWHQGEADCCAEAYSRCSEMLPPIFEALRRDLELYDVPFVIGGLGDYLTENLNVMLHHYPEFNRALRDYAAATPYTGYADASGLKGKPDHLHFDTPSLEQLGKRYYAEFARLENKQRVFEDKPNMDACCRTEMERL